MRKSIWNRFLLALTHPWLYLRSIRHIYDAFDHAWYHETHLRNRGTTVQPIIHFLKEGAAQGLDPAPDFSVTTYLQSNPDVAAARMNPFVHYMVYGKNEGRSQYSDRYLAEQLYKAARENAAATVVTDSGVWLSIIVPVYNTPPPYLSDLVQSYRDQNISGVELILSDDGSSNVETLSALDALQTQPDIKVLHDPKNRGISAATNAGLNAATGTWVSFVDHDDLLAPEALRQVYRALQSNPNLQFLYTDELIVRDDLEPDGLFLKPAYDPALLSGLNYINHLSVYRLDRVLGLGGLSTGLDGSQDHDLCLRYLDGLSDAQVAHLPYPAYWWRRGADVFSVQHREKAANSTQSLLKNHYSDDQYSVSVEPQTTGQKVVFEPGDGTWPGVSIVIPNKDAPQLLSTVLEGVLDKTEYPNFEVIVVDNGSKNAETLDIYEDYQKRHGNFSTIHFHEPFNFARSVNKGISNAKFDTFLLLNNDIEVTEPDWLTEMVSCLAYPGVGIVGAKLLFPDRTIQHAGVIVGFGDLAGHWHMTCPENVGGNMNRLHCRNLMTCVTGAAMLISRDCLNAVGPWDEENFAVAYNDVDFCLRAYAAGIGTLWTPFATLIHHESATRGYETSPTKARRFDQEKAALQRKHATQGWVDPTSHPAYSRSTSVPQIGFPDYAVRARSRFLRN